MKKNNKKGFSLVELSIVLIIIALLVSGVISGRSLINNSRVNLINSEYTTLKIAIRTYIDNNNVRDYTSTKINFATLINDGYLDDNSNFSSKATKADEGYPSKIAGANWYYDYDETNEDFILVLASTSGKNRGILEQRLCQQFSNRFGQNEKVLKTTCLEDRSGTSVSSSASSASVSGNGKVFLKFTIDDIFQ